MNFLFQSLKTGQHETKLREQAINRAEERAFMSVCFGFGREDPTHVAFVRVVGDEIFGNRLLKIYTSHFRSSLRTT